MGATSCWSPRTSTRCTKRRYWLHQRPQLRPRPLLARRLPPGLALLFDEYYDEHADYRYGEVRRAVERMAVALFVGTSFSVGVTEMVLREALGWRIPVFSIDPAAPPPVIGITGLRAAAEAILPAVCRELGATRTT